MELPWCYHGITTKTVVLPRYYRGKTNKPTWIYHGKSRQLTSHLPKFTCFGKANDWVVPTILHVKLLLRRIFELFSIFCGLKIWRRPPNLCWEMRMIWSDARRSGGFGQVWLSTIFDPTRNIVSLRTRRTIPYFPSAVLKLVLVFLRKKLYILWVNDILFSKKLFVSDDFQVWSCRRYKNAILAADKP